MKTLRWNTGSYLNTNTICLRGRKRTIFKRYPTLAVFASNSHEWKQNSFSYVAKMQNAFYETCIENQGRPAAASLSDFVTSAMQCAEQGLSTNAIQLELEYAADSVEAGLTSSDRHCQRQWILAIFMTRALYYSSFHKKQRSGKETLQELAEQNPALINVVQVIWRGLVSQDQSSMVQFDRSLATRGISGGVASEARALPAQFIPISQIILLTVKHLQESEES